MSKPYTPTVVVGTVVAGEAAATRRSLEELINSVNRSAFDIGELCHRVKSRGFYEPYTTFQEYAKTLPIKTRKVQYLTRMAGVFDQLGISRTQYEPLGVARCREITSLDPSAEWTNPETLATTPVSDFIKGFVEFREPNGDFIETEKLKSHVKVLKGFTGDNDLIWVNLCLTKSVHDNTWMPAIEKAIAFIGSVSKDDEGISKDASSGAAAEVIAANFLNDPNVVYSQLSEPEIEDEPEGGEADE